MKTNQVMIREMGIYKVAQRTKDSMFNASSLSSQWKIKMGTLKKVTDFLRLDGTQDFIEVLFDDIHKTDRGLSLRPDLQGYKIDGVVSKTNVKTLKRGGKIAGEYWFHPYLFIDFAMWMNPRFKLQVVKFVYDQLIEFRHHAGDQYRGLTSALTVFESVDYSRVARGLNYIVFGTHRPELRQNASQQELTSLSSLQEKLAFAVNMGYIKSFDELINEMRRIYRVRNEYLAL